MYIYVCVLIMCIHIYIYTHISCIYIYMCIYLYIPYTYTVHTVIMSHDHCYKPVQLCPKPRKSSSKLTLSTTVSLVSLEMCRLYTCWDTSLICCRVRTLDLIYIAQEYNISKHPNLQKNTKQTWRFPRNKKQTETWIHVPPHRESLRRDLGHEALVILGKGATGGYQGPSVEICWKNTVVKNFKFKIFLKVRLDLGILFWRWLYKSTNSFFENVWTNRVPKQSHQMRNPEVWVKWKM